MTKQEFVAALRRFAETKGVGMPDEYGHPDYSPSRGETLMAGLFASWIVESNTPDDDNMSVWLRDLPQYLIEAYADFATDSRWNGARDLYRKQTDHDIPDLVDVYAGGLHRVLVVHSLIRLMPLLTGAEWLRPMLTLAFNAQSEVIDHAWRRFVRVAYRALIPRFNQERHRGNSGKFGETELRTYGLAGRVLFTFARGISTVTYCADDGDVYGNRAGAQNYGAPYSECVAMIEDVVKNWNIDEFKQSDTVRII